MSKNYAIIIDGDNIKADYGPQIITQVQRMGNIVIIRLYGDFTKSSLIKWKNICLKYTIDCIQIWDMEHKTNSTDVGIITNVCFDVENNYNIDNYAIVSGDGDFVHLVSALKKRNKKIIGISQSKKNTSTKLVNACNQFIYLETSNECLETSDECQENTVLYYQQFIENLVYDSINTTIKASIAKEAILRCHPDFDEKQLNKSTNIKYRNFTDFINSISGLKIYNIGDTTFITIK
uniref:NYN domain protein n=1 Tax=Megaviridae environmental sample TaxID=1737588 RepID=A0A5J6VHS1_9VIRU|nr:MAG: NYN domain protein [Megaviridae environmental sample]